ncbi:MAG: Holliday junction resolvase RuvX [Pseudomonadota bacterium]
MANSSDKFLIVLGFDYGTESTGVAIGQTTTHTARPLTALKSQNGVPNWPKIENLIQNWKPNALVVGIPLNMDGSTQPITQSAKEFAQELQQRFNLPVHEIDERLTTIEARNKLFEEKGYKGLLKSAIDAAAATIIVENWLNQSRT